MFFLGVWVKKKKISFSHAPPVLFPQARSKGREHPHVPGAWHQAVRVETVGLDAAGVGADGFLFFWVVGYLFFVSFFGVFGIEKPRGLLELWRFVLGPPRRCLAC